MATFTATPATWTNNSDANFRAWGSYISQRLAAVGLVQTADTGQIDWLTVTTPASTNTFQGYEIWRFDDSLQASAPVFLKIEYGEANSTDTPSLRISVGSGSNGAGTLTGNPSSTILCNSASVTNPANLFGSGSSSRFSFLLDATNGHFLSIERTKDAQGNESAEGVIIISKTGTAAGSTSAGTLTWINGIGETANTSSAVAALFPAAASFAYGPQIGIAPIFGERPLFTNPALGAVGYYTENIASGVFSVYMYGTSHSYYAPSNAQISGAAFRGAGGGTERGAIRYE